MAESNEGTENHKAKACAQDVGTPAVVPSDSLPGTNDFSKRYLSEAMDMGMDKEAPSEGYHVSSSFSRRETLWPQTFGRQMEIYCCSPRTYGHDFGDAGSTSCVWDSEGGDRHNSQNTDSDDRESVLKLDWKHSLSEPLLGNLASGKFSRSSSSAGFERSSTANETLADVNDEDDKEQSGSTFLQACLNGTNVLAGVGILSTPYALSEGGWFGLSFLLLFATICLYTGILLRRCMDTDNAINSYPDIGQAAFGRKGRVIVSIMLYLELYCVAVEFLILEGDNLANLFPYPDTTIGKVNITAHQIYIMISALMMLPTVWLRDLSLLSYISAGGVVAVLAIFSTVGYVGAFEGVGFHHTGSFLHVGGLPVAVGICAFCFCGHAVFPSIYKSMKIKQQFSKVLCVCFAVVTIIYGGIGIVGYTMFGDDLESQVTLNLPRAVLSSRIAIWITLVNPFAKFALTITPLAVALEEFLPWSPKSRQYLVWGTCLRSMLVFSTVLVALMVPFFGLLMAFIGSFLSITVAIIIPCLCYFRIYGRGGGISSGEISLLVCIIFIGSITAFVCTYSAIRGMVGSFSD